MNNTMEEKQRKPSTKDIKDIKEDGVYLVEDTRSRKDDNLSDIKILKLSEMAVKYQFVDTEFIKWRLKEDFFERYKLIDVLSEPTDLKQILLEYYITI